MVGLINMKKALLGWEHAHPVVIGAWIRYILKTQEKTKNAAFMKALPQLSLRISWHHPDLAITLFSLNSQRAPVRSVPRRKFFSQSCCNIIYSWKCKSQCEKCARLAVQFDPMALCGQKRDFHPITMPAFAWKGYSKEARGRGYYQEHCYLKYGTSAQLYFVQREGKHRGKRKSWT